MPWGDWVALAAISAAAAFLQAANGFGGAVLAAPFFLLVLEPGPAIQLLIILSLGMSVAVLPGMGHAVNVPLLLRLAAGSVIGLPLGLAVFGWADPVAVRAAVGATILGFAAVLAATRYRRRKVGLAMTPGRDLAVGAAAGIATALVAMAGPPVLIYLMLADAPTFRIRATLLAFFVLCYAASILAHLATIGIPGETWAMAATLLPPIWAAGWLGRRVGDRLGADAAALLAIAVLAAAGLYTVAAAARLALS